MDKRLLTGNEIANHILTITHIEKCPSRYQKELWPFVTFAEFPDCHHEAGVKLKDNIDSWANEVGEAPDSVDYPKLNAELAKIGGIHVYFEWKNSKNDHRYLNVMLC